MIQICRYRGGEKNFFGSAIPHEKSVLRLVLPKEETGRNQTDGESICRMYYKH